MARSTTQPFSHRRSRLRWMLLVLGAVSPFAPPSTQISPAAEMAAARQANLTEAFRRLPMSFEANIGQAPTEVQFLARGQDYGASLMATGAIFALRNDEGRASTDAGGLHSAPVTGGTSYLRMRLLGAHLGAVAKGLGELPGKSNYFAGSATNRWWTGIPHYASVEFRDIYPGIRLIYYGNQRQLEYDFVVEPCARAGQIQLEFEGAEGSRIDEAGELVFRVQGGEARLHSPSAYQVVNGVRSNLECRYVLSAGRGTGGIRAGRPSVGQPREIAASTILVGLEVDAYDRSRPLTIDPVLSYSTYLGGARGDAAQAIAVDAAGNVYVTGATFSTNFPMVGPFQPANRGMQTVFVSKFNPAGTALIYSTYLGGAGVTQSTAIAVDAGGRAYVTGSTNSTDFPTQRPFQTAFGGGPTDGFLVRLTASGSMLDYSTYLGGSASESCNGIAVDTMGNAYLAGRTGSPNFPSTMGGFQATKSVGDDAVVAKINPSAAGAASLLYSTFLGGTGNEGANGIAVDDMGNAFVTGSTLSPNFPMASAVQPAFRGGDAFVTKVNPTGSMLLFSTYLGGSNTDSGRAIAVDTSGNAYVTGQTDSTNFPTVMPLQAATGGGTDAFVTKFSPDGSALAYSTYLGGSGLDLGNGIAADALGNAYVTGQTRSMNFPTASPAQASFGLGVQDAFVAKLRATGSALVYSSYLGGNSSDDGFGIALSPSGSSYYVAGSTSSPNFPTTNNGLQGTTAGGGDAFVAQIADVADVSIVVAAAPPMLISGQSVTYTIRVTNAGPDAALKVIVNDSLPSGVSFLSCAASQGECAGPRAGGQGSIKAELGLLEPGGSAQVTVVVKVEGTAGSTVRNLVTVSSATMDPSSANNSSSASTQVILRLLVSSFSTGNILAYNGATGSSLGGFASTGSGGLAGPLSLTFGPDGQLYVVSGNDSTVKRYRGTTGEFMDEFVKGGSGGLSGPSGLTFGPDGNLYVTSRNAVLRYDRKSGMFMGAFVTAGSGGLSGAVALVFGADGNLYVSNGSLLNNSVLRYNGTTGASLGQFVSSGSGGLSGPQGMVFGPDGNLYVSSRANNRVLRYNGSTGALLGVFASGGGLSSPVGLSFGPDGNLYVSSSGSNSVKRYDKTTGAFVDDFVSAASGGLSGPTFLIF